MLPRPLALAAVALCACGRYGFGDGSDGGDAGIDPVADCPGIPGALLCSGFEPGESTDWLFTTERQLSTVDTACPAPRTGQRCLVSHVEQGGGAARATHFYSPVGSGMLYARVYLFLDDSGFIDAINPVTLDADDSGVDGLDLNVIDDGQFAIHLDEVPSAGGASVGPVPRGSWFCLHAAILVDDSAGSVTAGYNDASLGIRNVDTYPNGAYDTISVGLDWTDNTQDPVTVLIDDVVVATAPVPCP